MVDPDQMVLALTQSGDFLVEREIKEVSIPVYDPSRGTLNPRVCSLAHGFRGNEDNSKPTQEILPEHFLSHELV